MTATLAPTLAPTMSTARPTRSSARRLALLAVLAGAVVLFEELVLWAGQPAGDPSAATVAEWYDEHATAVLFGDLLWLGVCGVLVALVWTAAAVFPTVPRWTTRALGLSATTALAVSGLLASQIALGVTDDPLQVWRLEVSSFRAGTVLLALCTVPLLDGLLATRRRVLALPAVLVGIGLAVPATAGLGVPAVFVVLALTLVVSPSAVPPDA